MRKMFSEKQIANVVNEAIAAGEIEAGGKIYNHIVKVSRTGDYEDDPDIMVVFQSPKSTYSKAEFEAFIKNVATVTVYTPQFGMQCLGFNGGYAVPKEGNYFLYWDGTNFKAQKLGGNSINFGTSFNTFSIVSKEI